MPRLLPDQVKQLVNAQQSGDGLLTLVDITDVNGTVARFCDNSEDVSDGVNTYIAYPFTVTWPTMEEGKLTEATLDFDNVSRILIERIRTQDEALKVKIKLVLLSDPTVVAAETPDFYWRQLTVTLTRVTGTLTLDSIVNEPYPKDLMSGWLFPALFFS